MENKLEEYNKEVSLLIDDIRNDKLTLCEVKERYKTLFRLVPDLYPEHKVSGMVMYGNLLLSLYIIIIVNIFVLLSMLILVLS